MKLPGKGKNNLDWTPLTACGEIYKGAIEDMILDATGLEPGGSQGWIAEYTKARAVIYYSLTDDEHDEVVRVSEQWNLTGIPKDQKKK